MSDESSDERQVARANAPYTEAERRAICERILRLRYGPFEPGEQALGWEQIAEEVGVSRSTLSLWRASDDYRRAEAAYRQGLREEARTGAAGMAQTALDHVCYLMLNARSEFVQLEAAKEVLKHARVEQDREEGQADPSAELIELQQMLLKRKARKEKLRAMGFDPDKIVEARVKDGGGLPDIVLAQNAIIREEQEEEAKRRSG